MNDFVKGFLKPFEMISQIWNCLGLWFILLLGSTIIDGSLTIILQRDNMELNPILNWLIGIFGVNVILYFKLLVMTGILFLTLYIANRKPSLIARWRKIIMVSSIMQSAIAIWGLYLLVGGV
jgi:hypothetical protein